MTTKEQWGKKIEQRTTVANEYKLNVCEKKLTEHNCECYWVLVSQANEQPTSMRTQAQYRANTDAGIGIGGSLTPMHKSKLCAKNFTA